MDNKVPNVVGAVVVGGIPAAAATTLLVANVVAGSLVMGPLIPLFAAIGLGGLIVGWVMAD